MYTHLSQGQREKLRGIIENDDLDYYDAQISEQFTEVTPVEFSSLLREATAAYFDNIDNEVWLVAPPNGQEKEAHWYVKLPEDYAVFFE